MYNQIYLNINFSSTAQKRLEKPLPSLYPGPEVTTFASRGYVTQHTQNSFFFLSLSGRAKDMPPRGANLKEELSLLLFQVKLLDSFNFIDIFLCPCLANRDDLLKMQPFCLL